MFPKGNVTEESFQLAVTFDSTPLSSEAPQLMPEQYQKFETEKKCKRRIWIWKNNLKLKKRYLNLKNVRSETEGKNLKVEKLYHEN